MRMWNVGVLSFVIVIFILLTGCFEINKQNPAEKLQAKLDSLKLIYAPDTRVALWDLSIDDTSGILRLCGEIDREGSFSAIGNFISDAFPEVENHLKLIPEEGSDQIVNGLINNSVANLRSRPRHSAEIATQSLLGSPVRVLKEKGDWLLVQTPNKYIAWVDAPALVRKSKDEIADYRQSDKIVYNRQYGFSYAEPDERSQTISDLVIGCIFTVIESNRKYYHVEYPDGRLAWVKKDEAILFEELINRQIQEDMLLETAKKFLGIPYLWGGTSSKSIDCSGFTSTVYYLNGIILQRDASQQTKYGKEITTNYDYDDLLPGDLLFYGRKATDSLPERVTHVAMYIGNSEFIHASGKVRINSIDSTKQNFIPEYVQKFVRSVRVNGMNDGIGIEHISENDFYKEIIKETE